VTLMKKKHIVMVPPTKPAIKASGKYSVGDAVHSWGRPYDGSSKHRPVFYIVDVLPEGKNVVYRIALTRGGYPLNTTFSETELPKAWGRY